MSISRLSVKRGVTFAMADALCWLLASLQSNGPAPQP